MARGQMPWWLRAETVDGDAKATVAAPFPTFCNARRERNPVRESVINFAIRRNLIQYERIEECNLVQCYSGSARKRSITGEQKQQQHLSSPRDEP
jgi:hypothetical protein